jgi:hypothetical protein
MELGSRRVCSINRGCLLLLGTWSHLWYIRGSVLAHLFLWLVFWDWSLFGILVISFITVLVNRDSLHDRSIQSISITKACTMYVHVQLYSQSRVTLKTNLANEDSKIYKLTAELYIRHYKAPNLINSSKSCLSRTRCVTTMIQTNKPMKELKLFEKCKILRAYIAGKRLSKS